MQYRNKFRTRFDEINWMLQINDEINWMLQINVCAFPHRSSVKVKEIDDL